jgi:hypothetical protein
LLLLAAAAGVLQVAVVEVLAVIEHQPEHLVEAGLLKRRFHWLPGRLIQ